MLGNKTISFTDFVTRSGPVLEPFERRIFARTIVEYAISNADSYNYNNNINKKKQYEEKLHINKSARVPAPYINMPYSYVCNPHQNYNEKIDVSIENKQPV